MNVKEVRVRNFRCIREGVLDCARLTILVGTNGSGKSSFLRALACFYSQDAAYIEDDFFEKKTSESIEITVTFGNLSSDEIARCSSYVRNGAISVTKVMSWPKSRTSQRYYGILPRHAPFATLRQTLGAKLQKKAYEMLRQQEAYRDLPIWTNKPDSLAALAGWERLHPESCEPLRDDGGKFGLGPEAEIDLTIHTRLVFVPAVEEAADLAAEGRDSALTQLMDLAVREALQHREEFVSLQREFTNRANDVYARAKDEELRTLQESLTESLSQLAAGAEIQLDWLADSEMQIPLPQAAVRLVEDGYSAPVGSTGHGLQRLLILTILQRLSASAATASQGVDAQGARPERAVAPTPALVLLIEEPELYQHPNRQKSLARVLRRFAEGSLPGVARELQVLFSTHSPLFVDVAHCDDIRVLRKRAETGFTAKATTVSRVTLEEVTREMERIWGRSEGSFEVGDTREKLKTQMSPEVGEGFFADAVVLVEGIEDKGMIGGFALSKDVDLEARGISVLACSGKQNIPRIAVVFRKLQIPTYVIWDNDRTRGGPEAVVNRRLLTLVGAQHEDFPVRVADDYAVFEENGGSSLQQELGQDSYDSIEGSLAVEFDDARAEFLKANPRFYELLFRKARDQSKESTVLSAMLEKILAFPK